MEATRGWLVATRRVGGESACLTTTRGWSARRAVLLRAIEDGRAVGVSCIVGGHRSGSCLWARAWSREAVRRVVGARRLAGAYRGPRSCSLLRRQRAAAPPIPAKCVSRQSCRRRLPPPAAAAAAASFPHRFRTVSDEMVCYCLS